MATKISYSMICACIEGEEDALKAILKHYEPMIVELSKILVKSDSDKPKEVVDEDIRAYIESELALAIVHKYDITRKPKNRTFPSNDQSQ